VESLEALADAVERGERVDPFVQADRRVLTARRPLPPSAATPPRSSSASSR
jgi:hypothetical protein